MTNHYQTLELTANATIDEVKKRYRELAKKYHPDNSKTGNADKFKEITSAYENILNPKSEPVSSYYNQTSASDIFNSFSFNFNNQNIDYDNSIVELSTNISFMESVFGCKKDIKYNRKVKCQACKGQGKVVLNNGCTDCGGKGQKVIRNGHAVFVQKCPKCRGRTSSQDCGSCSAAGLVDAEVSINVAIPGGVHNGNILRLSNMGNFIGNFGPIDQHTDAYLNLLVQSDSELSLVDNDVILKLNLTLSEAVKGCNKKVKTVIGEHEIVIPPLSKNKDEIIIPNLGVSKKGSQKNILNVDYPNNIEKIMEMIGN